MIRVFKQKVHVVFVGSFLLLCTAIFGSSSERLPNIVFFFCDDLGYADVGCYGHPYANTPAIDQLAREGTRFTQHYVTGVTCNPSRTGLMTGLFPARFQKYAADFGFGDRVSITELLKKRGYRTGHFGKWHIGPDSMRVKETYGFDVVDVIGKSKSKTAGRDDELVNAAIEFIKGSTDKPFYVNIWGHSTHYPVNVPENLAAEFKDIKVKRNDFSKTMQHKFDQSLQIDGDLDNSMRQYLGDVYSIDANVGRILKVIDELGIRDNTIFVFSSDHGPAPVILQKLGAREFSKNMLGYAGHFRGGKHDLLEGGVRVPFIIRWPGKVKANHVDTQSVVSFIDWMPTLCSIAGVDHLPGKLDGEDVSDIWFGNTRKRIKPLFWKTSAIGSTPVMRRGKWKLYLNNKRGKVIELYDLSVDPTESKNVAQKHPDILIEMKAELEAWVDELPKSYEKTGKKKKQK